MVKAAKIQELLKRAGEFEDFTKDVDTIMNKGLPPRDWDMGSDIILSNYKLVDADIYYTFNLPHEQEDSMPHQYDALAKRNRNCTALVIWPDYDLLATYDEKGSPMSAQHHAYDEKGKLNPKSSFSFKLAFTENEIIQEAGVRGLVTNKHMETLTKKHGYWWNSFASDSSTSELIRFSYKIEKKY